MTLGSRIKGASVSAKISRLMPCCILVHEHLAIADFVQDIQVHRVVRVQAEEHQPAVVAQAAEEVEHEADVAVLCVELGFVEQVHQRAFTLRACSSMNDGRVRLKARTWYDWW